MPRRNRMRSRLKRIATDFPDTDIRQRSVPATPETLRKLQQDVIVTLVRQGVLLPHHHDAAMEIRSVHEAVGRGMFARSSFAPTAGSSGRGYGSRDFTQRMSASERRAWETHYLPWSREMAMAVAAGLPGTRWMQLIIDIVVDNNALRAVEDRYRLRPGTAIQYLTEALDRYARHRGRHSAQVDFEPV